MIHEHIFPVAVMPISIWHMMTGSWVPGSACTLVKYVMEGSDEMPDLALCRNETCPARGNCYRFLAKYSAHQVYALFRVEEGKDRCEYYIPSQMELPLTKPS